MNHSAQIISGSLAASCFVALTQIVSRGNGELPAALSYAVMFFAVAIPLLVAWSIVPFTDKDLLTRKGFVWLMLLGWLAALAGLFCLFLSFGWLYATTFAISNAIALQIFTAGQKRRP